MRFVHTADWQLGMKASHVGPAASRVREERLSSARRVIDAVREHSAEFLLIAGDTFEDNGVERGLIQKVADILGSCRVPVYVIPGNHDPLTPGSVWGHPAWRSMDKVIVLREEEPVDIPGGVLYPCPVMDKHSRLDPTLWISPVETGKIRIGMAHGSVEGMPQAEPDHPISRHAAARSGMDYLAMGHWHSMAYYPEPDSAVRMAYCGTHETTKFGERDSGNILVVDIPAPGAVPVVAPVRTGLLKWKSVEKDILYPGDLVSLRQVIESEENPESMLLSLQLKGLLAVEDRDEIARIREILDSRFLFGRVDSSALRPSPEDNRWLDSLPPGIIQNAALRLQQMAAPQFGSEPPEGASPEVASRALMELYALICEVSP